jgi:hypothetical protein
MFNIHGIIHTRGDRLFLLGMLVLAAAVAHATNICTLACYLVDKDKDPLLVIWVLAGIENENLAFWVGTVFTLWSG